MTKKKKETKLSWADFQALGDPEATVPPLEPESAKIQYAVPIRIFKDRKKRRGKTVTLIKGLDSSGLNLEKTAKTLKSKCGVGGSVVDNDTILLQGDQLKKTLQYFIKLGFKDCKLSGI